jgi:hypothetical protein
MEEIVLFEQIRNKVSNFYHNLGPAAGRARADIGQGVKNYGHQYADVFRSIPSQATSGFKDVQAATSLRQAVHAGWHGGFQTGASVGYVAGLPGAVAFTATALPAYAASPFIGALWGGLSGATLGPRISRWFKGQQANEQSNRDYVRTSLGGTVAGAAVGLAAPIVGVPYLAYNLQKAAALVGGVVTGAIGATLAAVSFGAKSLLNKVRHHEAPPAQQPPAAQPQPAAPAAAQPQPAAQAAQPQAAAAAAQPQPAQPAPAAAAEPAAQQPAEVAQ